LPKGRQKSQVNIVCQNPKRTHHLKEKNKHITKRGKCKTTNHQRYQYKHYHTHFTQTKNTPLYKKHLKQQQTTNIRKHLIEKNGIRNTERLTDHHKDTIANLLEDMAEHATEVSAYFMKDL